MGSSCRISCRISCGISCRIRCETSCGISCGILLWDQLWDPPAGSAVGSSCSINCRILLQDLPVGASTSVLLQLSCKELFQSQPPAVCKKTRNSRLVCKEPTFRMLSNTICEPPWLFPAAFCHCMEREAFLMFSGDFLCIQSRLMWTRTDGSIVSNEQKVP